MADAKDRTQDSSEKPGRTVHNNFHANTTSVSEKGASQTDNADADNNKRNEKNQ